jgi:epoxyqueuosine reductase
MRIRQNLPEAAEAALKTAIQRRARELGFDACHFATAAAPETARQFENWLAARRHGEMGYLERNAHKRVDPQQVLAGAKSIISLAVSYGGNAKGEEAPSASELHEPTLQLPTHMSVVGGVRRGRRTLHARARALPFPTGLIARYARHADYHGVIGERLKSLAEFVNELGGAGARSLWYVDTGPLLERDLAQRAGLGFVGKHTNLIIRKLGNWIFLCEIITTLELTPDAPEKNHCGSCTRCLAACPTEAITAPFQLDARRCISYLTIELKGPIPVELRAAIGNRIYGCDDCLAVCPWNRFAKEGALMKDHARPDLAAPDLLELLALDDEGFKRRFAGTPMVRTKRRGLLRNVCVALGNVGDASALPALERASRDSESLIAEHAKWAIGRIEERLSRNDAVQHEETERTEQGQEVQK